MNSSNFRDITDELLSAYLDDQVTPQERDRIDAAVAADGEIAWRLESLRQTVVLLRALPEIPLPRTFALQIQDLGDVVAGRPEPSVWAQWRRGWREFWQVGNPLLRNAAAASFVITVVLLGGAVWRPAPGSPVFDMAPGAAPQAESVALAPQPAPAVASMAEDNREGVAQAGAETAAGMENGAPSDDAGPAQTAPATMVVEAASAAVAPAEDAADAQGTVDAPLVAAASIAGEEEVAEEAPAAEMAAESAPMEEPAPVEEPPQEAPAPPDVAAAPVPAPGAPDLLLPPGGAQGGGGGVGGGGMMGGGPDGPGGSAEGGLLPPGARELDPARFAETPTALPSPEMAVAASVAGEATGEVADESEAVQEPAAADTALPAAEETPAVVALAAPTPTAAPTHEPTAVPEGAAALSEPAAAKVSAAPGPSGPATRSAGLPVLPIAQGIGVLLTVMLGALWWRSRRD